MALSGKPQQYQSNVSLQLQVQQLSQQVENLSIQLQIQRDETAMWCNREKEMSDRCKSLYEQLHPSKDRNPFTSSTCLPKQTTNQLDLNNLLSCKKQEDNLANLQSNKDFAKNQSEFRYSSNLPRKISFSSVGQGTDGNQIVQKTPNNEQVPFSKQQKTPNNEQVPLSKQYGLTSQQIQNSYSNNGMDLNQHAYSDQKQREEIVQSIMKQYKYGSKSAAQTPRAGEGAANSNFQKKWNDDYSYNTQTYPITSADTTNLLKNHDLQMGEWKTKYDSSKLKLN